ncbi:MAG: hypothetical protein JW827_11685 [Spirochaetes bacterium]|nr:hypothetical protein [Spirochaetota bacterium]
MRMKIFYVILIALLTLPAGLAFGATSANVSVEAELEGLTMSIAVTDIQMTGKSGGTANNLVVEFGTVNSGSLINGKYSTAPEVLKIDFEPGNNIFNIQMYLANSNENYNVSKFKDGTESGYWNLGAEANGLIGTNNPDYVAAMLWSCYDNNTSATCSDSGIGGGNWAYFKDKYTHTGESATGLLLSTNASLGLSGKPNAANVLTASGRPMETWTWTWDRNWGQPESNPAHWVQGVDALGYKKIIYGTGGQFYTIAQPNYSEPSPTTDKTVYAAVAASFEGKPAQVYRTRKVYLEILNE